MLGTDGLLAVASSLDGLLEQSVQRDTSTARGGTAEHVFYKKVLSHSQGNPLLHSGVHILPNGATRGKLRPPLHLRCRLSHPLVPRLTAWPPQVTGLGRLGHSSWKNTVVISPSAFILQGNWGRGDVGRGSDLRSVPGRAGAGPEPRAAGP